MADEPLAATSAVAVTRRLYEAMARFDQAAANAMGVNLTDLHCIDLLKEGAL